MALAIVSQPITKALASESQSQLSPKIVLIHGLGRTPKSMWFLADQFEKAGFEVVLVGYRSILDDPETIIKDVTAQIDACCTNYQGVTHFVGHSLGGLLIRAYLDKKRPANLGSVVLIGSPSNGTAIVDNLRGYNWFHWLGPTALSLGSDLSKYPNGDMAPDYNLGVIAGISRPISKMNNYLLPGENDGLVTVASTKVAGMKDFLLVDATHAGLRYSKTVAGQVVHFLKNGRFQKHIATTR